MKKVFIHIGTEKTGSTTLQHFLESNEANLVRHQFSFLCDQDKGYFFRSPDGRMAGHFPVAACFSKTCPEYLPETHFKPRDALFDDLLADIERTAGHVVLSAEHFSSRLRSANDIRYLKEALSAYDTHVVVYVRPQYEMLTSSYNTGVQCGRRDPFFYSEDVRADPYFNHYALVKLWSGVFEPGKIIVRNFNSLIQRDIRKDFLTIIGIDHQYGFSFESNKNESLNAKHIELIRQANQHIPVFEECSSSVEWQLYCRARGKLAEISGLEGPRISEILSHDDMIRISELFNDDNRALELEFMEPGALDNWAVNSHDSQNAADLNVSPAELSFATAEMAIISARLEERIESLRSELGRVYSSTSWRATGFLRGFSALVRKMIH